MTDILHDFPIAASPDRVFDAVATPAGLDQWWTLRSSGVPREGAEYRLFFGPRWDWRAKVTACEPSRVFELELTTADDEWIGTRVRFELGASDCGTDVRFAHRGWPSASDHYRTSSYCWAMYLRLLARWLEHGDVVPYDQRLSA